MLIYRWLKSLFHQKCKKKLKQKKDFHPKFLNWDWYWLFIDMSLSIYWTSLVGGAFVGGACLTLGDKQTNRQTDKLTEYYVNPRMDSQYYGVSHDNDFLFTPEGWRYDSKFNSIYQGLSPWAAGGLIIESKLPRLCDSNLFYRLLVNIRNHFLFRGFDRSLKQHNPSDHLCKHFYHFNPWDTTVTPWLSSRRPSWEALILWDKA